MFVRTYAGAIVGIDAAAVTVEVNIAGGGLGMYLVGLPDSAVKESEQRIRAAFENSGERMSGRKVVVSLAPADLRKEGASFDLPIAVGILAAMSRVNAETLAGTMFAGELSLDGTLKPVRGVLPMAVRAGRGIAAAGAAGGERRGGGRGRRRRGDRGRKPEGGDRTAERRTGDDAGGACGRGAVRGGVGPL